MTTALSPSCDSLTKADPKSLTFSSLFDRWRWSYQGQALLNPFHAVALAAVAGLALVSTSWATLVALPVLEIAVLVLIPRSGRFQKAVDEAREEVEHEQRVRQREALLAQLAPEYRHDLERFEAMINVLRWRTGTETPTVALDLDERLPFEDLLTRYVQLAATHAECAALRRAMSDNTAEAHAQPVSGVARAVAEKRRQKREENLQALRSIEDELRTIREVIELAFEHAIAPEVDDQGRRMTRHFLEELDDNSDAIRSLLALRADATEQAWRASHSSARAD